MKKNHLGKKVIALVLALMCIATVGAVSASAGWVSGGHTSGYTGKMIKNEYDYQNGTFDEFYAHPDKGYVKQYERYTPKGYGHFAVNEYGKTANGKTHHIRTLDKDAWA